MLLNANELLLGMVNQMILMMVFGFHGQLPLLKFLIQEFEFLFQLRHLAQLLLQMQLLFLNVLLQMLGLSQQRLLLLLGNFESGFNEWGRLCDEGRFFYGSEHSVRGRRGWLMARSCGALGLISR